MGDTTHDIPSHNSRGKTKLDEIESVANASFTSHNNTPPEVAKRVGALTYSDLCGPLPNRVNGYKCFGV